MASSMKDIKNRIKSIEGTMQITKAMELVAASKLRKARQRIEISRPYADLLQKTITAMGSHGADLGSAFFHNDERGKECYILIAGDRGLAGGFNSNIFKKFSVDTSGREFSVIPIGKKAMEFCKREKHHIFFDSFGITEDVSIADCYTLGKLLCRAFVDGTFSKINIYFTQMESMLSQVPVCQELLPFKSEKSDSAHAITLYEPSASSVFERAAECFVSGSLYGALAESRASEFSARRMAMDNASKNAGEMIDSLTLNYNRARQAAITQEITEIVSGAEAL